MTISFDEFSELLKNTSGNECGTCEKQNFLSWENITPALDNILETLGDFEDAEKYISKNGYNEYHPHGTNYWNKDAPIAIQYYPYNDCTVRKCPQCAAIFLSYTEFAGHGPQHRLRYVREDLVYYSD
jgi:hypothetical protein